MKKSDLDKIVSLLREAQVIASRNGHLDILQVGLVREMILADILGHNVHHTKHKVDATDVYSPEIGYEYQCVREGHSFPLGVLKCETEMDREASTKKLRRADRYYFAWYSCEDPFQPSSIREVASEALVTEFLRRLERIDDERQRYRPAKRPPRKKQLHFTVPAIWVRTHGEIVWSKGDLRGSPEFRLEVSPLLL